MKLRSGTIKGVEPPIFQTNFDSNHDRKTSSNKYCAVSGQSQSTQSKRHNPMPSKKDEIKVLVICESNKNLNTKITVNASTTNEFINNVEHQMSIKHAPHKFMVIKEPGVKHKYSVEEKYIELFVTIKHEITNAEITCKYMKNMDDKKCPIYNKMVNYEYSEEGLEHLVNFSHFKDEYNDKTECKYNQECYAYKRLERGANRLDDRCHIKLYRHPPRKRDVDMAGTHPFLMDNYNRNDIDSYCPSLPLTKDDKDGFLDALIREIIRNGFENDLTTSDCCDNDDNMYNKYSILKEVDKKINCARHKAMGSPLNRAEMLAIILYTGCYSTWFLSEDQRNDNVAADKWKWFDHCLNKAIHALYLKESGEYPIYHGLSNVKLSKNVQRGKFKTFVSASWKKEVAEEYMTNDGKNKNGGMLIKMEREHNDKWYIMICCDVSWISKFPDECEVLIQRGLNVECKIIDQHSNGFQIVSGKIINEEPYGNIECGHPAQNVHFVIQQLLNMK